jgi:predicted acylesterase/phospholipase RssA
MKWCGAVMAEIATGKAAATKMRRGELPQACILSNSVPSFMPPVKHWLST